MKTINTYINEKLRLTTKRIYTCQPKNGNELREIVIDRIKNEGPNCDLNDIDTSKITDMSNLFKADYNGIFKEFNGDISMWDVSNVKYMEFMFSRCYKFNCDISRWDVSNVGNMESMFHWCEQFNQDLSHWNVSNVEHMGDMFAWCEQFNCDLSKWNVSKVENMAAMFYKCKKFNCDLSQWNVLNVKNMWLTFKDCPTKPDWYDEKLWEP